MICSAAPSATLTAPLSVHTKIAGTQKLHADTSEHRSSYKLAWTHALHRLSVTLAASFIVKYTRQCTNPVCGAFSDEYITLPKHLCLLNTISLLHSTLHLSLQLQCTHHPCPYVCYTHNAVIVDRVCYACPLHACPSLQVVGPEDSTSMEP